MTSYSQAAKRWIEPLLALNVGGSVTLRFLAPTAAQGSELGMVGPGAGTYSDYLAPSSYVRELTAEEINTHAGQLRQGAREVLLSDEFVKSIANAQGQPTVEKMLEAAAGALIGGQICRIRSFRPLDVGEEAYAWQLLCDAPLEAS